MFLRPLYADTDSGFRFYYANGSNDNCNAGNELVILGLTWSPTKTDFLGAHLTLTLPSNGAYHGRDLSWI